MLRVGRGKKMLSAQLVNKQMLNPLKAIRDPRNRNTEHRLASRRWWELNPKIVPNTAYRLKHCLYCRHRLRERLRVYRNKHAYRNLKCIRSTRGSRTWNAPQKNLSPDSLRDIRWHPYLKLKHSCPLLFNHFFPHLLRRKVLLHNEASHVHCFNTMIDPCQCLLLKLTLIYA